jgi:flagellar biosynthesis protein FliP
LLLKGLERIFIDILLSIANTLASWDNLVKVVVILPLKIAVRVLIDGYCRIVIDRKNCWINLMTFLNKRFNVLDFTSSQRIDIPLLSLVSCILSFYILFYVVVQGFHLFWLILRLEKVKLK